MSRAFPAVFLLAVLTACASTPQRNLDYERIRAELDALERDPTLGTLAGAARERARQALNQLSTAPKSERPLLAHVAERRVDIAQATAEAELAEQQIDQLARERDRILLEASRRDAETARLEAEKLRLQSLARAEEAERARRETEAALLEREQSSEQARLALAEAEQARRLADAQAREAELARREAELASATAESLRMQLQSLTSSNEARGQVMTLSGDAFASGQSSLKPEARANLQRVIEFVQSQPGAPILIEGHSDSTGSASLNRTLSQRRAEAVRDALIEEGIAADRMTAAGVGASRPVADNGTPEGRARNRRVEIILQTKAP